MWKCPWCAGRDLRSSMFKENNRKARKQLHGYYVKPVPIGTEVERKVR